MTPQRLNWFPGNYSLAGVPSRFITSDGNRSPRVHRRQTLPYRIVSGLPVIQPNQSQGSMELQLPIAGLLARITSWRVARHPLRPAELQLALKTHSGVSKRRSDGEWVSQSKRGGSPQGGPLSPLLSNLVLDELDRELERRGHRHVRYADDCNVYVRSERAGQRVMKSITKFITQKLKLKVNESKSAVARPQGRKFLGSALHTDQRSSAPSRQNPWPVLSGESERFHDVQRASASTRRWRNWPLYAGLAQLLRFLRNSPRPRVPY
jgi:hypothetical protein